MAALGLVAVRCPGCSETITVEASLAALTSDSTATLTVDTTALQAALDDHRCSPSHPPQTSAPASLTSSNGPRERGMRIV